MKIIEYASYDYSINETETLTNLTKSIELGANSISVLPYSLNTIKNLEEKIKEKNIAVSCVIDFPYGLSDPKSRIFAASQIVKQKNSIQYLDIMLPTKIISNRKYDKFREEIKNLVELCNENYIEIRYILEYRVFSHEVLAKVCQILKESGLKTILPSSGMMIDNIDDNLIACNFLTTKSNINTICTANIYTEKQVKSVKRNSELYGIRLFYLPSLELFNKISI
jgi:deoxyribose-phosphate aldolase